MVGLSQLSESPCAPGSQQTGEVDGDVVVVVIRRGVVAQVAHDHNVFTQGEH